MHNHSIPESGSFHHVGPHKTHVLCCMPRQFYCTLAINAYIEQNPLVMTKGGCKLAKEDAILSYCYSSLKLLCKPSSFNWSLRHSDLTKRCVPIAYKIFSLFTWSFLQLSCQNSSFYNCVIKSVSVLLPSNHILVNSMSQKASLLCGWL